MDKLRILFVDDEVNILNSLRRGLRLHCRDWDVKFCSSPVEALRLIPEFKPSAVVSDKRMPEMDGVEFLRTVSQQFPEIVRVMLTGDRAVEVALETIDVVHMLISKPFEIELLIEKLRRALCIQSLSLPLSIRQQLGLISNVPVLPKIYQQLSQYLKSYDVEIQEVSRIISQDPAMLAKLMQLANSAFMGFTRPVSNAHDMVMRLGIDFVKNMVLVYGAFKQCNVVNEGQCEQLLAESMEIAKLSQQVSLACSADPRAADDAFLVGLLHNIGMLMSNMNIIQMEIDDGSKQPREEDIIAAYLLTLWEFEGHIVNAVLFQDIPEATSEVTTLSCYLHVAKVAFNANKHQCSALSEDSGLNLSLLQSQGVHDEVISWVKNYEN